MKVCLLEDNEKLSQNIVKKFEKTWDECLCFSSIASFQFIECDVYIFDISLEKKSFDLMKEVRGKTNSPIVVYSAHCDIKNLEDSIDSWCDFFISKITQPSMFILKIHAIYKAYKRLTNK